MDSKKITGQITRGAITGGIIAGSLLYASDRTPMTALYGGLAGGGASVASDMAVDYVLPHLMAPKNHAMSASEHMILQPLLTGAGFAIAYPYITRDVRMAPMRLATYGAGGEIMAHWTGNIIHGKNDDPFDE